MTGFPLKRLLVNPNSCRCKDCVSTHPLLTDSVFIRFFSKHSNHWPIEIDFLYLYFHYFVMKIVSDEELYGFFSEFRGLPAICIALNSVNACLFTDLTLEQNYPVFRCISDAFLRFRNCKCRSPAFAYRQFVTFHVGQRSITR